MGALCPGSSDAGYYEHGAADEWQRTFEKLQISPSEINAICELAVLPRGGLACASLFAVLHVATPRLLTKSSLRADRKFMKFDEDKSHTISIWELLDAMVVERNAFTEKCVACSLASPSRSVLYRPRSYLV